MSNRTPTKIIADQLTFLPYAQYRRRFRARPDLFEWRDRRGRQWTLNAEKFGPRLRLDLNIHGDPDRDLPSASLVLPATTLDRWAKSTAACIAVVATLIEEGPASPWASARPGVFWSLSPDDAR